MVLVVDDETALHPIYRRVVEASGAKPVLASSCAEAEDLLPAGPFACALLDKNLPDGSGIVLGRTIVARFPETAVLLITGYATLDSVEEAIESGVFDYLVKPFDLELLRQSLTAALTWAASDGPKPRRSLRARRPLG